MIKHAQSYESGETSTLMLGLKIFGYSVLAGIMCLFVSLSLNMLSSGICTQAVGVNKYEIVNGEKVLLDTIMFDDTTTAQDAMETIEDDREIVGEYIMQTKSGPYGALLVGFEVLEQVLLVIILVGLTGYYVYREGDRDRNLVKHHQRVVTPLRGLWIGLIADVPALVMFLLLVVGKCGFAFTDSIQGVYRLVNGAFTPLIALIMPTSVYPATATSIGQLLCLLMLNLLLPVVCTVTYQLGFRRVFKKKRKKI